MYYLEIILASVAILTSLTVLIYNLIKKFGSKANTIFAVISFLTAGLFSLLLINILDLKILQPLLHVRIFYGLLLLTSLTFSSFLQLYPYLIDKNKILHIMYILPGYVLCAITVSTDYIISSTIDTGTRTFMKGQFFPVFLAVISFYMLASVLVIFINSKKIINRAFSRDMLYLFFGMGSLFFFLLLFSLYLPYFKSFNTLKNIGILLPGTLIILNINYAISNVKTIDVKKFYVEILFWVLIFTLLFIPVMLILKFNSEILSNEKLPSVGIALLLFIYLFLLFKFLKPRIETFFQKGYTNLADKLDDLFIPMRQLSISTDQETFWDDFFKMLIDGIVEKFKIDSANFFLFNRKDNKFIAAHSAGRIIQDKEIENNSSIIISVTLNPVILYKPVMYYDKIYSDYENDNLEFFQRNSIEVILPFLNPDEQIIGILALGSLNNEKFYSKTFLSILELYRIQFQHHLANALLLENIKATQVIEHDKMVVDAVKKKIIPQKLYQPRGMKVSSFYINNSRQGGDYFDSVKIDDDKTAILMSDSSYSGIDSAIISLELYTILHTPSKKFDSPDKILSNMNWVISTSRFSNKYSPAFCLIHSSSGEIQYSNAAYNPLILFNPNDIDFSSFDSEGVPIGIDKNSKYITETIKTVPGNIGILYSDGLISAINEEGETYDLDRIKDIVRRDREKSPSEITRNIYDNFNKFITNKKQINDVSIIIFKL